jgi:hypothetical protein
LAKVEFCELLYFIPFKSDPIAQFFMSFKTLYFVTILITIITATISCRSNSSKTIYQQDGKIKNASANTFISNSPLPKGAKPLHSLPENIIEYVKTHYPGYSIIIAVADPLCNGVDAIDVSIVKTNSTDFSLIFKPDGTFVQQEEDIPLNNIPSQIQLILKGKYADYSPGNQIEKVTLDDKSVQYSIDLIKENASKEVVISTEGNIICETK